MVANGGSTVGRSKAPAKQSQHANTTYYNIVGRNILRAFGHAPCCDMLGVVGSNLNIFKLEPTTPNMSQHVATRCMAKRTQHVAPNNVVICCVGMICIYMEQGGISLF